jgi:predicted phage terminase large subunit-like protein
MTRWAQNDLTGKLIREQRNPGADKWEVIEFPAILPNEEPVWPEYWTKESLLGTKASIPISKWNAQYMQNPTAEEGSILKRDWWQPWEGGGLPELKHVIQSYDTAFSKKETADYSAITTWGVFTPYEDMKPALILLDALRGRYDFPELKMVAFDQYKYWDPETVVVEKKATGEPLIQEMRKMGVPVTEFIPVRGKDKHARVHACAPIFESGQVFFPEGETRGREAKVLHMTDIPKKKPYTKKMFMNSTVTLLKGVSAGVDKDYMFDTINQNANKLFKSGVPISEIKGIVNKAKTAHGDWLRNYRKRELRKKMK